MALAALNVVYRPRFQIGLQCFTFTGRDCALRMPASLTQYHPSLTQRIAGRADLIGTIAVKRNLIAGKLLLLPIDFTLHETQFAPVIEAYTDMFRWFTVSVEFYQRERITLPAVFTGSGFAFSPRTKYREQVNIVTGVFTPNAYRPLIANLAACRERRKLRMATAGRQ